MKSKIYINDFGEGTGPHTPWGKAQVGYQLTRGVMFYQTAGHGGLRVTRKWAKENLSVAAVHLADTQGGYYWYEEDCQISLVLFEQPELWDGFFPTGPATEQTKETARQSIAAYYPVYFSDEYHASCEQYGICPLAKDIKPGSMIAMSQSGGNASLWFVADDQSGDPHKLRVHGYLDVEKKKVGYFNEYTLQSRLSVVVTDGDTFWVRPCPKLFYKRLQKQAARDGVAL